MISYTKNIIRLSALLYLMSWQSIQGQDKPFPSYINSYTTPLTITVTALGALSYYTYYQNQSIDLEQIPHAQNSQYKNIIFDLDGVLCQTNILKAFQMIGISTTLQYMAQEKVIPSEKYLFDALNIVPAHSTYTSYNKNLKMPQIMIDWQTGIQTPEEINQAITQAFQTSNMPATQRAWALQSSHLMLDSNDFIATRELISANVTLLHALKEKGYHLFILSNWDQTSFPLFQKSFPELFTHHGNQLFDGIMISGQVHIVKPELQIFYACLEKFNLIPHECIFIDDEPANIAAAKTVEITSLISNPAYPNVLGQELIQTLTCSSKNNL